ncbi:MAG: hypothetical protein ACK4HB_06465 [Candidatus Bipolaricaulia bacterium]
MTKRILSFGLLVVLPALVSGCFLTLGDLEKVFPITIGPASISNIRVEPATLPGGVTQSVTVSFVYTHEDGDLGLKARVIVKLSGATVKEESVNLDKTSDTVRVPVTVSTPNTETNLSLEVVVAIGDQMSASLPATIHVAADDDRDGVSNRDDACPAEAGGPVNRGCPYPPANTPECIWFVDAYTPPIKRVFSYKVGREIFAMVNDPDENISSDTVDIVFVWVTVPHTGDLEIFRLAEMELNSGIFTNVGPLLTSFPIGSAQNDGNLSVFDGDTLLMFYGDVNNFSQQCMAQAVAGG